MPGFIVTPISLTRSDQLRDPLVRTALVRTDLVRPT